MLVGGPSVAMAVVVSTILAGNGGNLAELAVILDRRGRIIEANAHAGALPGR